MNRFLITQLRFWNVITEKLHFLLNLGVVLDHTSAGGN